jgi:hypothetical protein
VSVPPPILAGLYVVAYANADLSVGFEQRNTLSVNGQWLGRVPRLAICRDFDSGEYLIQHCSEDWDPIGVAGGYDSIEDAKSRIERAYPGIGGKWITTQTSLEDARALRNAELRAESCSFCGRTSLEVTTMVGDSVRICGACIDEFHAGIHSDDRTT